MAADEKREFLRHTLATLAYRAGKVVRTASDGFEDFRLAPGSRSGGEILAHICDLLDWGLSIAKGAQEWHDSAPLRWSAGRERFFAALAAFDAYLSSEQPLHMSPEKIFQGPIADALNHTGQLAMMCRIAGSPVRGENYFRAEITPGRVGPQQTPPRREFD